MEESAQESDTLDPAGLLMIELLKGFYWFDEGLQNYLRACGWPDVNRPQSMVMANIVMGVTYPSEIARRLGVSRQAIHKTLKSMAELDMIALVGDPDNRRVKIVQLTGTGEAMRKDAQTALKILTDKLSERLGAGAFSAARAALSRDWGPPMSFTKDEVRQS